MVLTYLSDVEAAFAESLRTTGRARVGDGSLPTRGQQDRKIRAEVIRRVLFLEPLPGYDFAFPIPRGIHIEGAWIEGSLTLEDLHRGASNEAPPIRIERCFIDGDTRDKDGLIEKDVNFDNARLALLSLKGCRFVDLVARQAIINGNVDVSEVASVEDEASATGCLRTARQRDFDYRPDDWREEDEEKEKSAAKQGDDAEDTDDETASGSAEASTDQEPTADEAAKALPRCAINFQGAIIGGDFKCNGARLAVKPKDPAFDASAGGTPYALRLSGCQIAGDVLLQPDVGLHGGVNVQGISIDGTFWGQSLCASSEWGEEAIRLQSSRIRGSVALGTLQSKLSDKPSKEFRCHGQIDFYGCRIDGEFYIGGGTITAPEGLIINIRAYQSTIAGHIRLLNLKIQGPVDIVSSRFGSGEFRFLRMPGNLTASDNTWTDSVVINVPADGKTATSASEPPSINLDRSTVGANIKITVPDERNLSLTGSRIEGNLSIKRPWSFSKPAASARTINLQQVRVGGDLDVDDLPLYSLQLQGVTTGRNATFKNLVIHGGMDARNAKIGGNAVLQDLKIQVPAAAFTVSRLVKRREEISDQHDTALPSVDFESATIAGSFDVDRVTLACPRPNAGSIAKRPLACYPGWWIVEAEPENAGWGSRSYLWNGSDDAFLLDGTSPPIHRFNAALGNRRNISLATARDYLIFFCANVWGEDGPFRIMLDAEELQRNAKEVEKSVQSPSDATAIDAKKIPELLRFAVTADPDPAYPGAVLATGVPVMYSWHVFIADFRIRQDGMIEMLRDQPIIAFAEKDPLHYSGGLRSGFNVERSLPGPWTDLDATEEKALRKALSPKGRAPFNLSFVRCGLLRDNAGSAWRCDPTSSIWAKPKDENGDAQVRLRLDGFDYGLGSEGAPRAELRPLPHPESIGGGLGGAFGGANPTSQPQDQSAAGGAAASVPDPWQKRQAWLRLQYADSIRPADKKEFDAQPYEHLIQLYRRAGRGHDAINIIKDRIQNETRLRNREHREACWTWGTGMAFATWFALLCGALAAGYMELLSSLELPWIAGIALIVAAVAYLLWVYGPDLIDRLYRFFFDYGLSVSRPILTFTVCIALGAGIVEFCNQQGILILDETPAQTRIEVNREVPPEKPDIIRPCGDQINSLLYAVDVFIPLIDLRQEMRCRPRPDMHLGLWQIGKSLYSLLGWLVTSLTLLAITGVIRRRSEG